MTKYTVISDYGATGEGRTISIWMGFAENEEAAKRMFETSVHGGDWYIKGATTVEGFAFSNPLVKLFMTKAIRAQLSDEICYRSFSAQLHFNYS